MIKYFSISVMLLMIAKLSVAQFSITGEIRPRFEYRNGYKESLPDSSTLSAFQISQRTRIELNFKKNKLQTKFSIQDVRIWGDEEFKKDVAGIAINEAWLSYNVTDNFIIKAGRQYLKYDNQRLMTWSNWNQSSAKHDALKLAYEKEDFEMDLVSAFNQVDDLYDGTDYSAMSGNYKTLNILWIAKKINKLKIASLSIADGYQMDGTNNTVYLRFTTGGLIAWQGKKFVAELRPFYQMGSSKTGQKINAYLISLDLSYKPTERLKISLGNELKSGNDLSDTTNVVDNAFDILYGAPHRYNGYMDYFGKPSTTKNAGLNDTFLRLDFKITDKASLAMKYHYFLLSNNFVHEGEIIDKYLGSEAEITGNIKITDDITVDFGYCLIFGSGSLEIIKGGESRYPGQFGYLTVTVKPKFFESK